MKIPESDVTHIVLTVYLLRLHLSIGRTELEAVPLGIKLT